MILKEEANEKVKEGWLRVWMIFEVLAINEKTTRESLESLMNKLEKDSRVKVYKKEFGELKKVEKPLPNIEFGYSLTCEVELISKKFDDLVQVVIEYGPSAIELLEPLKFNVSAGDAQTILNSISHVIHDFAAAGVGGIVFIKGEK
ncbi:MAG: hypothetical protein QXD43_00410 [Candidatus Aenigmatarchaeota archaeon]